MGSPFQFFSPTRRSATTPLPSYIAILQVVASQVRSAHLNSTYLHSSAQPSTTKAPCSSRSAAAAATSLSSCSTLSTHKQLFTTNEHTLRCLCNCLYCILSACRSSSCQLLIVRYLSLFSSCCEECSCHLSDSHRTSHIALYRSWRLLETAWPTGSAGRSSLSLPPRTASTTTRTATTSLVRLPLTLLPSRRAKRRKRRRSSQPRPRPPHPQLPPPPGSRLYPPSLFRPFCLLPQPPLARSTLR